MLIPWVGYLVPLRRGHGPKSRRDPELTSQNLIVADALVFCGFAAKAEIFAARGCERAAFSGDSLGSTAARRQHQCPVHVAEGAGDPVIARKRGDDHVLHNSGRHGGIEKAHRSRVEVDDAARD